MRLVEQLVVRQDQMRPVGNEDPPPRVHALGGEPVELREESLRVEHDPVADDATGPVVQDTRGNLVQDELGISDADGVAGVGSALVADHEIRPLGEHVDQLALAFVAPLGADDNHAVRLGIEHVRGIRQKKRAPSRGPQRILW